MKKHDFVININLICLASIKSFWPVNVLVNGVTAKVKVYTFTIHFYIG